VLAALSSGFLLYLAGAATSGPVETHLPEAVINFSYAVAIVVTLCARQFKIETGRVLTRLLNWALLLAFPGGTVVGLYGLLRADRSTPA
jgi:hypothetical protein